MYECMMYEYSNHIWMSARKEAKSIDWANSAVEPIIHAFD